MSIDDGISTSLINRQSSQLYRAEAKDVLLDGHMLTYPTLPLLQGTIIIAALAKPKLPNSTYQRAKSQNQKEEMKPAQRIQSVALNPAVQLGILDPPPNHDTIAFSVRILAVVCTGDEMGQPCPLTCRSGSISGGSRN
jgi:hypothetical protein